MKSSDEPDSPNNAGLDDWRIPIRLLDIGVEAAYSDPAMRSLVEELIACTIDIGVIGKHVNDGTMPNDDEESVSLRTLIEGLKGNKSIDSASRAQVAGFIAEAVKEGVLRTILDELGVRDQLE